MTNGDFKKIPTEKVEPSSQFSDDGSITLGQQEALFLNQGLTADALKSQSEKNEHDRTEKFRDAFECIAIISLYMFFGIVAILIISWIWHIVAPTCWHWLSDSQMAKIQTLATGGIVASVAAGHVKKRLGP